MYELNLLTVDYLITDNGQQQAPSQTIFKETAHLLTKFYKSCHKRQRFPLGLFSLLKMLRYNAPHERHEHLPINARTPTKIQGVWALPI